MSILLRWDGPTLQHDPGNAPVPQVIPTGKQKPPPERGSSWNPSFSEARAHEALVQADFLRVAAFFAAGLVTVALAPATAGLAACGRLLP
jgi:hypothetical protein